ncbi:MAG: ABC transporter substrate-binding protein [Candidatus Ornithospirochaeta sp.]
MQRIIIVLCIVLSLLSCTGKEEKTMINIAVSQEPVTTDVMVNTSLSGRLILVGNVYEKLLVLDGEGNVRCELAEDYRVSDDGRKISFSIQSGVKFHDGSEMDSGDVALSLNRWISVYAKAREMTGGALFEVDGDECVVIESEKNLSFLPYLMASSPQSAIIVPKESIAGDSLVTGAPGTGPYVLASWSSGEKMVLEKFQDYVPYSSENSGIWGEKRAECEILNYYFVPDSTTRLLGLRSGEYDFINDLMSEDRAIVDKDSNLEIVEGDESGLIALVFNKKEGVMADLEIRKAASLSFDPDELMASCYGDYGYSLHSDYMDHPSISFEVEDTSEWYGRNEEKASSILKGAEYNGDKIRILTSNLSNMEKIAYAAESEMEKVGFDVEVIVTDWAGFMEKRKDSASWDIFISAFSRVPLPQMKSFLSPTYPGWMEEESEAYSLFLSLDEAKSIGEAGEMWQEVQKAMWDYIPVYVPGHYTTAYASSSSLSGIIVQDGFYLWNAEKK